MFSTVAGLPSQKGLSVGEPEVHVQGHRTDRAMVAQLRAKPGGEHILVTVCNFAEVGVDCGYSLKAIVVPNRQSS